MKKLNSEIERYRIRAGKLGSDASYGNNGFFVVPYKGQELRVIASDGMGWEHVSVSLAKKIPTWEEMCFVKDLFFDSEETVVQFHPKKSEYVNYHPNVLHLWRRQGVEYELPEKILIVPM